MSLTKTSNEIKIMIGIPSFKRSQLLAKALENLNKQTYKNFKVLVSVNGNDKDIKSYQDLEKKNTYEFHLQFYYHNKEIDTLNNFFFLLKECKCEYFMWLADDDTISPNCLEKLSLLLDRDKNAVTAVPYWELVEMDKKKLIKPSNFQQNNALFRIISFCNKTDDVFFYGLHRTANLKNCSFKTFWTPNKNLISRWAYVYIFDLVIQGKIIFDPMSNAKWVNNQNHQKHYKKEHIIKRRSFNSIKFKIKNFIKSININYIYLEKIFKWGKFYYIPVVLPILLYFLLRDMIFGEKIFKEINKAK